jgi:hypothetical protein
METENFQNIGLLSDVTRLPPETSFTNNNKHINHLCGAVETYVRAVGHTESDEQGAEEK